MNAGPLRARPRKDLVRNPAPRSQERGASLSGVFEAPDGGDLAGPRWRSVPGPAEEADRPARSSGRNSALGCVCVRRLAVARVNHHYDTNPSANGLERFQDTWIIAAFRERTGPTSVLGVGLGDWVQTKEKKASLGRQTSRLLLVRAPRGTTPLAAGRRSNRGRWRYSE